MKTAAATFLTAFLAAAALADAPLQLEFPRPKVTRTPVPISLPHLEAPNTPQPDIIVPDGTVNLAARDGVEVTSSDPYPVIGDNSLINDGEKESEEGYYVEYGEGQQWVQIDLGAPAALYAIAVWHYHGQARAYHDVIVQVSDDPEFKTGVTTLFNNDHDNSSGMGKGRDPAYLETNKGRAIPAKGTVARYVRLWSRGNSSDALNHYIEVEVWGVPKG